MSKVNTVETKIVIDTIKTPDDTVVEFKSINGVLVTFAIHGHESNMSINMGYFKQFDPTDPRKPVQDASELLSNAIYIRDALSEIIDKIKGKQ